MNFSPEIKTHSKIEISHFKCFILNAVVEFLAGKRRNCVIEERKFGHFAFNEPLRSILSSYNPVLSFHVTYHFRTALKCGTKLPDSINQHKLNVQ